MSRRSSFNVRGAKASDVPLIADIEQAAGLLFANAGMPAIAEHPPTPQSDLRKHLDDNALLVATEDDSVVGFATLIFYADHAHLDQMAVNPRHGRKGHGTRLLEAVCTLASKRGATHVTLTTFERIPWNAPYYAQRGFRTLTPHELTPELRRIREVEQTYGLDPQLRVVMRKELPQVPGADSDQ